MDRTPTVAGMFYPATERAARREIEAFMRAAEVEPTTERPVVGGIAPHAGWTYSGATAAYVYAALQKQDPPDTVVVCGAVHTWGVTHPSVYASGSWQTPLGSLQVDAELAESLLDAQPKSAVSSASAHAQEHSIEVQAPFIKYIYPDVRILPIAMPPTSESIRAGRAVAQATRQLGRRAIAIGSTDLTHYGPRYGLAPVGVGPQALEWVRDNDRRIIDLALDMAEDEIIGEAMAHHNACGAGAVAATIAFCREMGATEGRLLHYTTSHDVLPQGQPTDMVGYCAIVFF